MKVTLTNSYVLVETDDIDFTDLRKFVEEFAAQESNVTIDVTDYKEEE